MFHKGTFSANPGLRRLIAGQIPSDFADWLSYVAIATLLAFRWDAPMAAFAWFAVALGLPYLTVGLVAGALVDRMPVRRTLVLANLGRGAVFLAMTLAQDWITLLLLLAVGQSVDSFFTPAKQAAIQALVRREDRMAANGISQAVNQASKVVAPALGGALLALLAPSAVFLLNAAVSLVAALILAGLPRLSKQRTDPEGRGLLAEVVEGITIVRRSAPLRATLALSAGSFFAIFFYDPLISPLLRELGHPETAIGWVMAAFGGGGVFGALWVSGKERAPFRLIGTGALVSGAILLLPGLAEITDTHVPLGAFLVVFVLGGVMTAFVLVPPRVVIQNETDEAGIGRVTALFEAVNTLALLSAPFAGAALAAWVSTGAVFVVGGALQILIGVAALLVARRFAGRDMRRVPR